MPSSDSDSDSDSSDDGGLGAYMQQAKQKSGITQFECFDESDEGTIVDQMKAVLALRESLGMDKDREFMADLEKREKEKKMLESMTVEERMKYEEDKASERMDAIRAQHAEKMKDRAAANAAEAAKHPPPMEPEPVPEPEPEQVKEIEEEGEKKKKKKVRGSVFFLVLIVPLIPHTSLRDRRKRRRMKK
jgi:hypothetical protein